MEITAIQETGKKAIYDNVDHICVDPPDPDRGKPLIIEVYRDGKPPVLIRIPEDARDVWRNEDQTGRCTGHWFEGCRV